MISKKLIRTTLGMLVLATATLISFDSYGQSLQELPQFKSENSAMILGLDKKNAVTEADIKLAAKRLLSRFHPDKFGSDKFSDADRLKANEIAKKIISAQDSLTTYIKINPAFSPAKESGSSGQAAKNTGFQNSAPHSDQGNYTWQEFGAEMKRERTQAGTSVVDMDHYGNSMRGTMFEFLQVFREADFAYLELSQGSTQAASHDAN